MSFVTDPRLRLELLYELARSLNRHLDVQPMLDDTLRLLGSSVDIDGGWLMLQDGPDSFRLVAASGLPKLIDDSDRRAFSWGPCRCQRRAILRDLPDTANILHCERLERAGAGEGEIHQHLSVPFDLADGRRGLLNLAVRFHRALEKDELTLLGLVVEVLSSAVLRAEAHHAVRTKSEEVSRQLYDLLEATSDYVGIAQVSGPVTYLNPAMRDLLGLSRDEDVAHVRSEIVHPLWATRVIVDEAIPTAIREGSWFGENAVITRDGQEITTLQQVLAHKGPSGEVQYVSTIIRNVDEYRKVRDQLSHLSRRLGLILDSAAEGIIGTDAEGTVTFANRSATEMTGFSESELIGRPWQSLVLEHQHEPPAGFQCNNCAIRTKDGRSVPAVCTGVPIEEGGSVTGAVMTFHDVTWIRQNEEQLARAQKTESLVVMAGGIAHDFNNILTVVIGYLSMAMSEVPSRSQAAAYLQEAEKACVRAKGLTQQILIYSRGGETSMQPCLLPKLVSEASSFALAGSNVRCELDLADDLWAVEADEGQIGQVLRNLVMNAAEAMAQGGTVRIVARNLPTGSGEPDRDYVSLRIVDRGSGIPADVLPRIFDPYFTTKAGGTGLGLAVSHSIVERHGGDLVVERTSPEGTTMVLRLPATRAAVAQPKGTCERLRGAGRVLVMDDQKDILRIAQRMLEHAGYEVETAGDGSEAIRLCERAMRDGRPFVVAILDLTVPGGMGGAETAQRLAKIDEELQLIATSGYDNGAVMAEHRRYGFHAAIAKPYTREELCAVVAASFAAVRALRVASGGYS